MEGRFELQFEDNEYYLVDVNTNDTVATTDKVLLKEYDGYMKKLSLKNCQAIENGYDLDELALEAFELDLNCQGDCNNYYERFAFKLGFQKALEILGDKKFSEDDMRRALSAGLSIGYGRQFEIENKQVEIDSYIKSLQQTEWDCIIFVDEKTNQPLLDNEGNLILKRK